MLKIFKKVSQIRNQIFSFLVRKELKYCGDNFKLSYPFYFLGYQHIEVGNNFCCLPGGRIEAVSKYHTFSYLPSIIIGENVTLNFNTHIACINKIYIGNNVLIGSNVIITDHLHGNPNFLQTDIPPNKRSLYSKGSIIIEDNVWIGDNVAIMSGITIGQNSIVGANAVVTKSFPMNSIIGGVPAKILFSKNGS